MRSKIYLHRYIEYLHILFRYMLQVFVFRYTISWNKAIDMMQTTHPGSVTHLSGTSTDYSLTTSGFLIFSRIEIWINEFNACNLLLSYINTCIRREILFFCRWIAETCLNARVLDIISGRKLLSFYFCPIPSFSPLSANRATLGWKITRGHNKEKRKRSYVQKTPEFQLK